TEFINHIVADQIRRGRMTTQQFQAVCQFANRITADKNSHNWYRALLYCSIFRPKSLRILWTILTIRKLAFQKLYNDAETGKQYLRYVGLTAFISQKHANLDDTSLAVAKITLDEARVAGSTTASEPGQQASAYPVAHSDEGPVTPLTKRKSGAWRQRLALTSA